MSNLPKNPRANKLVNDFEKAARAVAFRGTRRPEEYEQIDQDYEMARLKLLAYIDLNSNTRIKDEESFRAGYIKANDEAGSYIPPDQLDEAWDEYESGRWEPYDVSAS